MLCASRIRNLFFHCALQSTLIISKSKGLSEILRDICTSTYQICRKKIKQLHLRISNLTPEARDIMKYCGKEEKLLLRSNFSSFPQYFTCCRFPSTFSLWDERLFEISEVGIRRANWVCFIGKKKQNTIYPKYWDTLNPYHTCPNIWTSPFTLVLLNPDIPYLCKQCRSRSVGF